jgi:excisionase family DNA binding protein
VASHVLRPTGPTDVGDVMSVRVTSLERRAFFTPRTLAQYLGVSDRTVRSMLAAGKIASYRVEGSRRIDPADVDKYLAQRREGSGR